MLQRNAHCSKVSEVVRVILNCFLLKILAATLMLVYHSRLPSWYITQGYQAFLQNLLNTNILQYVIFLEIRPLKKKLRFFCCYMPGLQLVSVEYSRPPDKSV